ncbi:MULTISPECIES: 2-isopropylmalate synthase [Chloroflexus]|uniref:2-isopropylmalate synthase n=2 Tax=Chloroflexus aggregans TaxID=152260 RepID=B8G7X2_CHLAD|nr:MULTISPECIES: 2-isopropylmalate synthase [Chloroflexus]ACL24151.1 2-isopropylmalate synthase [Chloroflexus aggregans DSM 9485]GIV90437.1 MAG: 2-isopropylmalate synthase [Chloroflexus sp.]
MTNTTEPSVEYVRIFDTTLRDGEQAPGCTMTLEEKLEVARQLARLNVDIIEAGFPAASPGDWAAVHEIAREIGTPDGPIIAALARANRDDIDKAWSAIQPAAKKRIHTFMSTSDIHLEYQFRKTRAEALQLIHEMVSYARSLCEDVEFSPMDAGRTDPLFLREAVAVAVAAGATTLNIPDTVGYLTPDEYGAMIRDLRENVPGIENCILSTHCHDDLGMAVANSLAGVRAGARQVECTINGIGERAGNASLEEVVMALHTRQQYYGLRTRINTREIARTSRLVSSFIGVPVPPNKAIVGANAFAHESGIHQDGVLKYRQTYEIMSAETVGFDSNTLVLGKHSGRHAFRKYLEEKGYKLNDDEFQHVFARFKDLCDRKKKVDDRDIEALIAGEMQHTPELYKLDHVQYASGVGMIPTATVRLIGPDGQAKVDSAQGTGPVDAVYQAINRIIQRPNELIEFSINAITEGLDAVAEVTVRIREQGSSARLSESSSTATSLTGRRQSQQIFSGYGVHTDTIVAAAQAYMAALNKMLAARQERIKAEAMAYSAGYSGEATTLPVDIFGGSTLG